MPASCVALLALFVSFAAFGAGIEPIVVTSASKQFVVRGKPQTSSVGTGLGDTVYPEPALLVMVCEQVRQALNHELGWGSLWRDSILINVFAADKVSHPSIEAIPSGAQGWRYRVDMPDKIERREFLGVIIEVVLLEYANRGAHDELVELPPWLIEGMIEHLTRGPLAGITLHATTLAQIESNPVILSAKTLKQKDVDKYLRAAVLERGALTVDQLNWPEYDEDKSPQAQAYRTSAHLFVRELLKLKDGPASIAALLAILPEHLNWQMAFLRAFDHHFKKMLDVEKWWSLAVTQTKMREQVFFWSARETESRLDEILYTSMQVHLSRDELPHVMPVSLQTVLGEYQFEEQQPILNNKLKQLSALRVRVPKGYMQLVEGYYTVLDRYFTARTSKKLAGRDNSARQVKALLKATVAELARLDAERAKLSQTWASATASEPAAE